MVNGEFSSLLFKQFNHDPTKDQVLLTEKLEKFLLSDKDSTTMLISGYAGTGKTSLVAALVKTLPGIGYKSVLLAPTGRAAKVLSSYARRPAFTIHRVIYTVAYANGKLSYQLRQNNRKNILFIVDEASMISGGKGNGLLEDLFSFVFAGSGCKLILIGDQAQLPPVHSTESPAMDANLIERSFYSKPYVSQLSEVIRQEKTSGILYNATQLRNTLKQENGINIKFKLAGYSDLYRVVGTELEDFLNQAYGEYGDENVMVLCRSNKRANLYNQQIRIRIKWLENELAAGDLMMVVKNNYHWLDTTSQAGFIANGDIIEIMRINKIEELHGYRFADVNLRMIDYPDQPEIEVKLILDAINTESASLSFEDSQQLYQAISEDYAHISDKRKKYLKIKKDPYYNALQVKFSYAITCHKSQGGQWDAVFIDQGYLKQEMIDKEYVRWLYTAMTRAAKKLYFVNFNESFFIEEGYS